MADQVPMREPLVGARFPSQTLQMEPSQFQPLSERRKLSVPSEPSTNASALWFFAPPVSDHGGKSEGWFLRYQTTERQSSRGCILSIFKLYAAAGHRGFADAAVVRRSGGRGNHVAALGLDGTRALSCSSAGRGAACSPRTGAACPPAHAARGSPQGPWQRSP